MEVEIKINNIEKLNRKIIQDVFIINGINLLKTSGCIDGAKAKKSIVEILKFVP
ncbi:MAG: hypothetical protein R3Y64_09710 [Peptostreptococcaceae bacterium]